MIMAVMYDVSSVTAYGKNINQLSMENHSDKMKVPKSRKPYIFKAPGTGIEFFF